MEFFETIPPSGVELMTGRYTLPPLSVRDLIAALLAGGDRLAPDEQDWLVSKYQSESIPSFGVSEDLGQIAEAGWGVVFSGGDPAVRAALEPLLAHRRAVAGEGYREFTYRPGESPQQFLVRHRIHLSSPSPRYLLLIGAPDQIPWEFQRALDVSFFVGRLSFDAPQDYQRYAQHIVETELGASVDAARSAVFGPTHDETTALSTHGLLAPVIERLGRRGAGCTVITGGDATKARLLRLLDERPDLLLAVCHGLGVTNEDPRQRSHQGALVCQDWPGPSWPVALPPDCFLSADDVRWDVQTPGMLAFLLASFAAGTPHTEEPVPGASRPASAPFVAPLARTLLSTCRARAVVGNLGRAWPSLSPQSDGTAFTLQSVLLSLLDGVPIGLALNYFAARTAEMARSLSDAREDLSYGAPSEFEIARSWLNLMTSRGLVLLGDPAVRLMIAPIR